MSTENQKEEVLCNNQTDQENAKESGRNHTLAKLKDALVKRRDALRNGLNEELDEIASVKNYCAVGDVADIALKNSEDEFEYQIYETGLVEYKQIERAVKRINNGSYGTCEDCGRNIPIERLKVLPFAGKCVKCQQISDETL
ncbi:MAG: TraR/DksA family transcriptional regulator [Thermoguttaceae bacterium]